MAGIYIHIPFCKKACHYCNFHFSTSLYRKPELIKALLKELEATAFPVDMEMVQPAETIYFGGGTPSLLTPGEIESILGLIHKRFNVAEHAEITLEANPDDITHESLTNWKLLGINRLSIGIQSFRQQDLEWMNRAHHARQALNCIELAQAKSFTNLNIDL
ncbi:MAG: radical SAM protein, partial [Chitinophagaceae bacterium]|nr:radical SAM protein [Chitinophagaceae bacterium]